VTDVLLEKLGANRRVVVRPNLGDTSAPAVLIDRDHVVDVRELAGGAVVLASSGLSHFPQKTTGTEYGLFTTKPPHDRFYAARSTRTVRRPRPGRGRRSGRASD
jgi:hypothetical protein